MKLVACCIAFCITFSSFAQNSSDTGTANTYLRTVHQRADKIVAALDIKEPKKSALASNIIANQYKNLSDIQADRDQKIQAIKVQFSNDKEKSAAAIKKAGDEASARVDSLHATYLAALSAQLSKDQVTRVKDGMTYNVLPITYKGYQEMIVNLTEPQKKQIMDWLIEAREHAMDAESSDKKHAWFGKYKGRINNYLSAQGYDVNKASKEWQERIKAEQAASKN